MVAVRSITLLAMLAAAVTSTRTDFKKRVSTTETVVFRSDLKEGEGQSDKFKNLILSTTPTDDGGREITFVNNCERDRAAGALIKSDGIPLTTNSTAGETSTFIMTIGTTTGDDMTGRQPVLLSPADQPADSQGWLYEQGGELKLDTQPSWDSWAICSGADHPELFWVAVVQGVVRVPSGCSLVRLFIIQFAQLSSGVAQGNC